jgi:macrolide-specific efflux system membrane fusion protein
MEITIMKRPLACLAALAALAAVVAPSHAQRPAATGRSIAVEGALVTLIDDVKVPAADLGTLMSIDVKEGESIEKGQLLAKIDDRETLAKQKIAQAELDAANEQAKSEAELRVAEAAVEVSDAELQSNLDIRKKTPGAVSETEIRKYRFQLKRAEEQVNLAKTDRVTAGKTAKVKEAQLDATAIELDRRQVKSPFHGQVIEVFKKVGEWCQPGEPIMHVVGLDRVRVKGFVTASLASPAEVLGKRVTITVYSAGEKQHTMKGIVGFASPVIEGISTSRSFRIWADVENERLTDPVTGLETWKIQPGSMANMTIDLTPVASSARATTPSGAPITATSATPAAAGSPPAAPIVRPPNNWNPKSAPTPKSTKAFKPVIDDAKPKTRER